jgi:hypothetical protein
LTESGSRAAVDDKEELMKRARKAPDVPLKRLRLSDLFREPSDPRGRRLVTLKVPYDVLVRVHELASRLGVTKSAAIVALLNEGLHAAHNRGLGRRARE